MRSSVFAASLLASLVVANPVQNEKRAEVTSWVVETATITVTASWGDWEVSSTSTTPTPAPVAPTSAPAAPTEAAQTWSAWTPSANWPQPSQSAPAWGWGGNTDGLSDYAAPIIRQHNLHRANHSAPPLAWDDGLASIAQTIAEGCVYAHDTTTGGGGYGQNIGAGAPGDEVDKMITNQMYNDEMMLYPGYGGEPDMSDFENWGHFSQIVWVDTTSVGCYTAHCTGGLANVGADVAPYFTVCNYKSAGNFGGRYGSNVLAPQGAPINVA